MSEATAPCASRAAEPARSAIAIFFMEVLTFWSATRPPPGKTPVADHRSESCCFIAGDKSRRRCCPMSRCSASDTVEGGKSALSKHHQPDLTVLDISRCHGVASQPFYRRPVGHQVFVRLNLCRELKFQDALLSLIAIRNLKRNAHRPTSTFAQRRRSSQNANASSASLSQTAACSTNCRSLKL